MPIYEFRCSSCETKFERLILKRTKPDDVRCPDCATKDVVRLFSSFGIGSGEGSSGKSTGKSCGTCRAPSCATCR